MTSLHIRVNNEFVLDAGTREVVMGARGGEQIVHPPTRTMFDQVVAYLRTKPAPSRHQRRSSTGVEGIATASVALRWGSYLAVLFDRDKSVPADAKVGISRISDDEMARINIEASAALAEWIDILCTDFAGYLDLVDRAIAYLPLVHRTATPMDGRIMALASPKIAGQLIGASDPTLLTRVRADADRHPNRLVANALMNVAWRNGPVEDVHAGKSWSYPFDQRRVTPAEERRILMDLAASKLEVDKTFARGFPQFRLRTRKQYQEWLATIKDRVFRAGVPLGAELQELLSDDPEDLEHTAEAEAWGFNAMRLHPDVYMNELLVGIRIIHQVLPEILKKLEIDFKLDEEALRTEAVLTGLLSDRDLKPPVDTDARTTDKALPSTDGESTRH